MAIAIRFENPPGNILDTRRFDPGQPLRVWVDVEDSLGLPGVGQPTTCELYGDPITAFSPYYEVRNTSILGHIAWDIVLPTVETRAKVRVTVNWDVGSNEVYEIPIGIGVAPAEIPKPMDLTQVLKLVAWAAVGAGALYFAAQLVGKRSS